MLGRAFARIHKLNEVVKDDALHLVLALRVRVRLSLPLVIEQGPHFVLHVLPQLLHESDIHIARQQGRTHILEQLVNRRIIHRRLPLQVRERLVQPPPQIR